MTPAFGLSWWGELLAVLAAGSAAVVVGAALGGWLTASAAWRRAIWQAGTLGLLAIVGLEFSGVAGVAGQAARQYLSNAGGSMVAMEAVVQAKPAAEPAEAQLFDATPAWQADHSAFEAEPAWSPIIHEETPLPAAVNADAFANIDAASAPFVDRSVEVANDPAPLTISPAATMPSATITPSTTTAPPAAIWWPAAIWLCGVMIVLSRIAIGRWMLARMVRRSANANSAMHQRLTRVAGRLGARRRVRLIEVDGLTGPIAFGIRRPTIALPASLAEQFDAEQQEAMLAHELAHLAGHDPAWLLAADLACALFWWQPLAWWSARQLRAAGESVADEASLVVNGGPGALAGALVDLGRRLVRPRGLAWVGVHGAAFRSGLGRRVARLLSLDGAAWRPPRGGRLYAAKLSAAVVLSTAAVWCTAWARGPASFEPGEPTMPTWQRTWRQSLAGLTLAAVFAPATANAYPDEPEAKVEPAAEAPAEGDGQPKVEAADPAAALVNELFGPEKGAGEGEAKQPADIKLPPEVAEKFAAVQAQIKELIAAGKKEEAHELEKQLHESMKQYNRGFDKKAPQLPPEVAEKVQAMKGQINELRNAGKKEEAREMERQLQEIVRQHGGRPEGDKQNEPRRRLRHLRAAIDNLHAAGMLDVAERLTQQARQLEEQLGVQRREKDRRPDGPPSEGGPRPVGPPPEGDRRPEGDFRPTPPRPEGDRRPDGPRPEGDRRPDGPRPEGDRRPDGPPPDGRRPDAPRDQPPGGPQPDFARELMGVMRELRGELDQLRREVHELRERIDRPREERREERRDERREGRDERREGEPNVPPPPPAPRFDGTLPPPPPAPAPPPAR